MPDDLNFFDTGVPMDLSLASIQSGGDPGQYAQLTSGPDWSGGGYEGATATGPQLAGLTTNGKRRGLSRGMRSALMVVVRQMGIVAALYLLGKLGYDVQTGATALLSAAGKGRRGRGITFRQLNNARRVNRTIDGMYHQLHGGGHRRHRAAPYRRRRRRS